MKVFSLTPVDAWFFRDGRPYNKKEASQEDVASEFPPPARTLSGAMRAALARANGWSGSGPWKPELNRAFGPGAEDLGELQFTGPFVIRKLEDHDKALWPMPRHLLGRVEEDSWAPKAFLGPSETTTHCDAGNRALPSIVLPPGEKREGLKPSDGLWITVNALQALLAGKLSHSSNILASGKLWVHESRVALFRDETTLTTGEGALYSPAYVRLRRGVSLGVGVAGVSETMKEAEAILPLGGESRLAHCEAWNGSTLPLPPPRESFKPNAAGRVAFTVILLTPGCFREPEMPGTEIVSACVGKPQLIGGWDSLKREPLSLEPFAPAGSVWFCASTAASFAAVHAQHGTHLGKHAAHGFGQIVIGHWPRG